MLGDASSVRAIPLMSSVIDVAPGPAIGSVLSASCLTSAEVASISDVAAVAIAEPCRKVRRDNPPRRCVTVIAGSFALKHFRLRGRMAVGHRDVLLSLPNGYALRCAERGSP